MEDKEYLEKIKVLEQEYAAMHPVAENIGIELSKQLQQIFNGKTIALGYPIQSRTKSWESIKDKMRLGALKIKTLKEIQDIIGLRVTLLFQRDVEAVCRHIENQLVVLKKYNAQERLKEDQFGYSSTHYLVALKEEWFSVPTFSQAKGFIIEIQVRTLAQHIWAEVSHRLQYKQEASVPPAVRRSIHRVSAMLEIVDLEFERVLKERDQYEMKIVSGEKDEVLNVDLLRNLLDRELPAANKTHDENYSELLTDLLNLGVSTREGLLDILKKHKDRTIALDSKIAKDLLSGKKTGYRLRPGQGRNRLTQGVFFTHAGLVRTVLDMQFGGEYKKYIKSKYRIENKHSQ